jgi:glutamine cyclotransferase
LVLLAAALGCTGVTEPAPSGVPTCSYAVVSQFPHRTDAYTQGLAYGDGHLFESTGLTGRSSLREIEVETGSVLRQVEVPSEYFAEGLALVDDRLFQLTWTSQTGFVYDVSSFQLVGEFSYAGEGWGLTYDGRQLIMSDGTGRLRFVDPVGFTTLRTVEVMAGEEVVDRLNELEYVDGEIWANVWQTDRIARIDPASGRVNAWIDLTGLLPADEREPLTGVLNGIAHDAAAKRIFVTGKFWPSLFEIRLDGC